MKSVLVTGGAGFIGSHTIVELTLAGYKPVILDDFSNANESVLSGLKGILGSSVAVHRINCLDQERVEKVLCDEHISSVIHFAAFKSVGESVEFPLKYYHNNIGSLVSLLGAMGNCGVNQLVFSSSCTVYGQPEVLPVTELSPILPSSSPYGYTKQVCEQLLQDYCISRPEFKVVSLRYFNPIGAHPSGLIGELPNGTPNNLVPFITQTAAGKFKELVVHGNDYQTADGSCIRDYIHVSDLAEAHVKSLEWMSNAAEGFEVFNLGQGFGNSVLEVIQIFEKATGIKLSYRIGPRRAGDVEKIWADTTKIQRLLHWKTRYSLEDAVQHAWLWQNHLKDNE